MERTITVRGTGSVQVAPDTVELELTLSSKDRNYDVAVSQASTRLEALERAVQSAGFTEKDLKTSQFQVSTEYEGVHDAQGNYKSVFAGYRCTQGLRLRFDFDPARLGQVLSAIAASGAEPELQISFTVKEPEAVREALLQDAAENARKTAQILCAASGVRLGSLLRVDYNWLDVTFQSETVLSRPMMAKATALDNFVPEDISRTDSASFTWALEEGA